MVPLVPCVVLGAGKEGMCGSVDTCSSGGWGLHWHYCGVTPGYVAADGWLDLQCV